MAKIIWMDDRAGKGTAERLGFDALIYFVEKNGHSVTIASTGDQIEAAMESLKDYDLLILDILMESFPSALHSHLQYGGIDVLTRMADTQQWLPIIVLSVMPGKMIREEAQRRGLDIEGLGVKEIRRKGSVTPSELAADVERHLGSRQD